MCAVHNILSGNLNLLFLSTNTQLHSKHQAKHKHKLYSKHYIDYIGIGIPNALCWGSFPAPTQNRPRRRLCWGCELDDGGCGGCGCDGDDDSGGENLFDLITYLDQISSNFSFFLFFV